MLEAAVLLQIGQSHQNSHKTLPLSFAIMWVITLCNTYNWDENSKTICSSSVTYTSALYTYLSELIVSGSSQVSGLWWIAGIATVLSLSVHHSKFSPCCKFRRCWKKSSYQQDVHTRHSLMYQSAHELVERLMLAVFTSQLIPLSTLDARYDGLLYTPLNLSCFLSFIIAMCNHELVVSVNQELYSQCP